MARVKEELANLETCERCQSFLQDGQEVCSSCGKPTRYMSFKARAQYEVEQWRQHKQEVSQVS